jgi:hypothetical protein
MVFGTQADDRIQEQSMMNNEEALDAFGEFLDGSDLFAAIAANFGRERLVASVREFGQAIEPVPLAKATRKQMRAFVRDQGQAEVSRNPVEQRILKQRAQLRRLTYEAAMEAFAEFRRESLRKNPN